jgi:hypothetical protein
MSLGIRLENHPAPRGRRAAHGAGRAAGRSPQLEQFAGHVDVEQLGGILSPAGNKIEKPGA